MESVFKIIKIRPAGLAALGIIVVMSSFMLAVVLVMAGLSVLPLHMAGQHLAAVQARLIADAGLEEFKYWYYSEQASQLAATGSFCMAKTSKPLKMQDRFNSPPPNEPVSPPLYSYVFPLPSALYYNGNDTCSITFKSANSPYYSVNNSLGDQQIKGCSVGGTYNVPPFSIDLVITVQNNSGGAFHYEALMTKEWPYAIFSMGGMDLTDNTTVCGDVAITKPYWCPVPPHASQLNNRITIGGPICCCGLMCGTTPFCPDNLPVILDELYGGGWGISSAALPPGAIPCKPGPGVVNGNATVLYTRNCIAQPCHPPRKGSCRVLVYPKPCGILTGQKLKKVLPYLAPLLNPCTGNLNIGFPKFCPGTYICVVPAAMASASPVEFMRKWSDQDALYMGVCPCPSKCPKLMKPKCTWYLEGNLLLGGTGPAGCACATTTNYYYKGSLVNYVARQHEHPCKWCYSNAGISLENSVLFVCGDIDMLAKCGPTGTPSPSPDPICSGPPPPSSSGGTAIPCQPPPNGLSGTNATLVVKGKLRVQNGQLSSGDGSFVIMACCVDLEAGGTFNGLLIARRHMRIETEPGQTLCIVGGVLARGSCTVAHRHGGKIVYNTHMLQHALTITGTTVKWRAANVKGLNVLAEMSLKSWRLLP